MEPCTENRSAIWSRMFGRDCEWRHDAPGAKFFYLTNPKLEAAPCWWLLEAGEGDECPCSKCCNKREAENPEACSDTPGPFVVDLIWAEPGAVIWGGCDI